MNHVAELKNLANAWNKYRKMQHRLTRLRNAKPNPANVPNVKAILAEINKHISMMDSSTERIMRGFKEQKQGKTPPPANDQFVN